ncbi:MAG: isoprenylcysteine carboxylmethyltransferase family protein [Chitinophagales bacterium]|nr:isoprenylcysteine carboxylmethyltransferase family protein [Chitinophagales bacterium]MCZ2393361.1 isoprenylcysteine carboxylmethyltransferase family protein [Chitinophagales bacterium]
MKKTFKDYFFVSLQGILFISFIANIDFFDLQIPYWIEKVSILPAIAGVYIVLKSILQLNKNISPFPTPKQNGQLIVDGLYKYVRHPIYSGVLIACISVSIYTNSEYRLLVSILLYILFYFKSKYEEERLSLIYPKYSEYKKTRARFFILH